MMMYQSSVKNDRGGQRGVSRVLTKLENSIESGNYYEAHQMYRTLYFRYTGQQKYTDCLELLWSGAMKLVSKQQETSAADLALLLIDTLEKRGSAGTEASNDGDLWIDRLATIIGHLSATTVERETLVNRAIKWSSDMSGNTLGHPSMHKAIAQVFWAEGNYEQARHHFLLSRDGNLCGRILIKIHKNKGYDSELDLFIVQAVLQQLCLKDRRTSEETFISFTTNHSDIRRKEAPFKQPLLNFVYFLFRCIDTGRQDAFRALCDLYKPSLNRDPSFEKYLIKIGVHFFGVAPPSTMGGGGLMGGMFGDLFTRLFQGFDDDDDESENGPQPAPFGDVPRRTGGTANAADLD
ncbi:Golgi to ER traffic protein 4 homolog isoform X2 [Rhagoletis pomonella]|uniref:Golgi to ER traffic protein 4 homolog isoform X2 n=1 Tax=Rhagoletis pomonella TaxID=28610 RepID=UPI001780DDC1|nr:Golgi to ER traffic protein 4 homolog isoform X2 [Rhagoletis pomonella]